MTTTRYRRQIVAFCCYCKRGLIRSEFGRGNSLTLDHVVPRAAKGRKRVPCCRDCNGLKGSLSAPDWFWFIKHHKRWWKTFRTSAEVAEVIRRERVRRVRAKEPQISWETTK